MAEERQAFERLVIMETKLDILIESVSKLESVDSKATESLLISRANEKKIEEMEKNRKLDLRLLWGTLLAGFLPLIINFITK